MKFPGIRYVQIEKDHVKIKYNNGFFDYMSREEAERRGFIAKSSPQPARPIHHPRVKL